MKRPKCVLIAEEVHQTLERLHLRIRDRFPQADMHQLTKDPDSIAEHAVATPHTPQRVLTPYELARYLDYCTEMLSLISKTAFLYVQDYHDPVAAEAVNDLEDLTNGLSSKIWQKIMMLPVEEKGGSLAKLEVRDLRDTPAA